MSEASWYNLEIASRIDRAPFPCFTLDNADGLDTRTPTILA